MANSLTWLWFSPWTPLSFLNATLNHLNHYQEKRPGFRLIQYKPGRIWREDKNQKHFQKSKTFRGSLPPHLRRVQAACGKMAGILSQTVRNIRIILGFFLACASDTSPTCAFRGTLSEKRCQSRKIDLPLFFLEHSSQTRLGRLGRSSSPHGWHEVLPVQPKRIMPYVFFLPAWQGSSLIPHVLTRLAPLREGCP